jgi:ATP-dependent DNA helicase RecG
MRVLRGVRGLHDEGEGIAEYLALPKESRGVEFKEAKSRFDTEKLLDYCTAIANCGGGVLILGVTDRSPREVCGTRAVGKPRDAELLIHQKLGLDVVIREHGCNASRVVVVKIPNRLPGVPVNNNGRYLTRKGESLVPMEATELVAIVNEKRTSVLESISMNAVSEDELDRYIDMSAFFELSDSEVPEDIGRRASVYVANRFLAQEFDGLYGITMMGGLLFARDLRKFPSVVHRRLRFIKYRGMSKIDASLDREYWRGYALEFDDFLADIRREVPMIEDIGKARRTNTPLYLDVTIRELVANAMSHQDFDAQPGQIRVELYENRLEVTNPGRPVMDVKEFVRMSNPRNVDLSAKMREMNMCENRGSGIQRLLSENEIHRRADPEFQVVSSLTKARITGKQNFTSLTLEERLWAVFMHTSFRYESGGYMTNATFRERYGLGKAKTALVTNAINTAIEAKMIRQYDETSQSRRYAKYVPFWA